VSAAAAREQRRWLVALGAPLVPAAVCVALALTTTPWLFAGAVLLVPVWIGALAFVALSSDLNVEAARAESASVSATQSRLPLPSASRVADRRAA
jgi:hypothetical protein